MSDAHGQLSIRQHTTAYVGIRQHTSAYVSVRVHTNTDTCACQARTDFYDEEDENMYYAMMARHDVVLNLLALLVLKLLVLKYFYDKGNENMCYDGAA